MIFNITQNSEQQFVEKFCVPLSFNAPSARGLNDDVAVLEGMIIKTDSIAEGVHLKFDVNPKILGRKLYARGLSDIACKGGFPIGYTLAVFTGNKDKEFLERFLEGFTGFDVPLIGGDACKSLGNYFTANITIFAKPNVIVPHRNGAKEGDFIYMTGKIGRAFLGFLDVAEFLPFYHTPLPKLKLMQQVIKSYNISSSIDVSDGFLKDLMNILSASDFGAEIDLNLIQMPNLPEFTKEMLTFGDDYEVIFTSKDEILMPEVTKIGVITPEKHLKINNLEGINFTNFGFSSL
jgi:thiamine-monophosphate kinase